MIPTPMLVDMVQMIDGQAPLVRLCLHERQASTCGSLESSDWEEAGPGLSEAG